MFAFSSLFFVFLSLATSVWAVEFDLHATSPACNYENHKPTFCLKQDSEANADRSGLERRIIEIIETAKDPENSSIAVAYFSFSHPKVFTALCERGKRGIPVTGFFDTSYGEDNQLPQKLVRECQGPRSSNVRVFFMGTPKKSSSSWRIHHNKFLIVDNKNERTVSINYSSGNLSSYGLSNHLDHWVLMTAERESLLAQNYFCVLNSMIAAAPGPTDLQDDPKVYQASLRSCLNTWGLALNKTNIIERLDQVLGEEEIFSLFAPSREDLVYFTLKNQIDAVVSGGKIQGAIQHFMHRGLAADLRAAVDRGVEVSLVMDDDVFLGTSGVPQARQFFFRELVGKGIHLRLADTNNKNMGGFEPPQMMHHKFLILEGVLTSSGLRNRVFSGAGQFTNAAMKNNYENFGLLQNEKILSQYRNLFMTLWNESMDLDDPILKSKKSKP